MRNKIRDEVARGCRPSAFSFQPSAFSLVEVLAAISIIGIITFLAIPNIVRIKQDGEDSLARARAETLNMAIASYVQAVGTNAAQTAWSGAASDAARYTNCLARYVAFSESTLTAFTPAGYSFTLPTSIVPMTSKTSISNTSRAVVIPY
jgi:prepilin-type N-terminal cleavage/methylation domain-containing protein